MATSTLDILVRVQDMASKAIAELGGNVKASLDEVQGKANEVATTFGLLGAGILGGVGLLVNSAADEQATMQRLSTAVGAVVDQAKNAADSDSALAKQKANLEEQLRGVNASLAQYAEKADTAKGVTGAYAAQIEALQVKAGNLRDKLAALDGIQQLSKMTADEVTAVLEKQASANTSLGFSEEESAASLQMLITATHSVSESLELNTVAMDLARAKHEDLATATQQVTMAYEGNGKALKSFGINLKDGLTNMQAVEQLGQVVAGQAEDFTHTLDGQTAVTKAKFNELADSLGRSLLPALTTLLETLAPIIDKFAEWINEHPKLTAGIVMTVAILGALLAGIAAVAGAISGAITIVGAITTAVGLFGTVLAFVAANPIVLIIAAIVALGFGIYELITHWQQVSDFTRKVWSDIVGFIEKNWKLILNILMPGMGSLLGFIIDHLGQIQAAWDTVWGAVSSFFIGIWDGIKNALTSALTFLKTTIEAFISWATGVFQPILNAVNAIGGAASGFSKAVSGAASSALSVIGIHDAIITPGGQVIQSDPADYLIATKTPGALAGGGGGISITINGGTYYTDRQSIRDMANEIAKMINQNLKLRNYAS